ncbi:uncharacterized protein C8R40DRAFT_1171780 [Lentinula edodes]|uniref:uncharacterized protein n=1 Tax=Lentinula edodes TaxID=5353 RepID=UPI001BF497FB|nr:uncharacterized protein C8R40DRAFT_1171780 [Lentinula edodes]KAF8830778.1 hypothetical protein HHX47_DHR2000827 [Lentinula edodes]KAH7874246.1 hypothetical protein C8R40DRAFT_1171780 [Lentinula edodes]
MFTPPASPLPSPRAKLGQVNPMEEIQRQSYVLLTPPSSGSTGPPRSGSPQHSRSSVSSPSYFSAGSSLDPPPSKGLLSKPSMATIPSSPSVSPSCSSTPSASPLSLPSLSAVPKTESIRPQRPDFEFQSSSEAKRRIGRRIKWTAIAIPAVLILVTLANHCFSELLGMVWWVNDETLEAHDGQNWLIPDTPNVIMDVLHPSHIHHNHVFQPLDNRRKEDTMNEGIFRRQESTDISVSVATGTATASELVTPTSTAVSSTSGSATTTTSIPATSQTLPTIPDSAPVLPTPFPQPWDSSITQNFSTQSCYNFFLNMTNSDDFRSCRPFGLLQNTSDDFADLQSNLTALNAVVWGTCNPTIGVDQCTTNMATFAASLQSACAQDLQDSNLYAVSTLQALNAYSLTQSAGCLNDPSTDSYCYVKAVHNTNPSDLYFYSLVSGVSISNSTTLTCSTCTKSLMSLYVNALNVNASQLMELASVYASAEALASSSCGSSYAQVSTNTQADSSNSASKSSSTSLNIFGTFLASLLPAFLFLP